RRRRHRPVVEEQRAVGLERDRKRGRWQRGALRGARQLDLDRLARDQVRGEHEDDQQHEHDVDQRRDVDLGDDAAPADRAARHHRPSWGLAAPAASCGALRCAITSRDVASARAAWVSTWRISTLYIATDGSATSRPMPVATSASAMPDITACVPWI